MRLGYLIPVLMALVGVVFVGQGLGYIGGSSMTGSSFWAVVGALLLIGATLLTWWTRRARAQRM